jgi:hypothetical protein
MTPVWTFMTDKVEYGKQGEYSSFEVLKQTFSLSCMTD